MTNKGKWQNRIIGYGEEAPDQLLANPKNFRVHPKGQQDALLGVIRQVGIVDDVLVSRNSGCVIDGHLRVALAISENQPTIPVKYLDLTEEEEALILATFDPLSAMATADKEQLDALLREVSTGDAAVQAMLADLAKGAGLTMDALAKPDPGPQVDKAAELQEKWACEVGQYWAIGNHRLLCGDSTSLEDIRRLMDGNKAALLFTSPPYWVGKDYEGQVSEANIDTFIWLCVQAWTDHVRVDEGRIIVNTGTAAIHRIEKGRKVEVLPLIDKWANALKQRGWLLRHCRIWAKGGDLPARVSPRTDVVDQHWEHLATFANEEWDYIGAFWCPAGGQRGQEKIGTPWAQQGVWADIPGNRSAGGLHIAAFPVELPTRHLMLYTKLGEVVADFFGGSGTTMVAAEQLKRVAYLCELEPKYCACILERMAGMGLEPKLAEGGSSPTVALQEVN